MTNVVQGDLFHSKHVMKGYASIFGDYFQSNKIELETNNYEPVNVDEDTVSLAGLICKKV